METLATVSVIWFVCLMVILHNDCEVYMDTLIVLAEIWFVVSMVWMLGN